MSVAAPAPAPAPAMSPVEGTLDADFLCVHGYHLGTHCPVCGPAIQAAVASIRNPRR